MGLSSDYGATLSRRDALKAVGIACACALVTDNLQKNFAIAEENYSYN